MDRILKKEWEFARNLRTGGLTADELRSVRPMLRRNNCSRWQVICPAAAVYFAVLAFLSVFSETFRAYGFLHVLMSALCAACGFLLRKKLKENPEKTVPVILFMNAALLLFSVLVGSCLQKEYPAVTIVVLLAVLPQVTIDVPWIMDLLVTAAAVLCGVCCLLFKRGPMLTIDLFNLVCFCALSVSVNTRIICQRLSGYLNAHDTEMESCRDPLTRVKNKTAYEKDVRQLRERLKTAPEEAFALVVADVNGLKKMNDTYGHEHGDDYIVRCCQKICEVFMHSAVYRIGGDEFLVLLRGRDYRHRAVLLGMAEDSCEPMGDLAEPWNYADFAVGMAEHDPAAGDDFDAVFRRADEAMYASKKKIYSDRARRKEREDRSNADLPENLRPCVLVIDSEKSVRNCVTGILKKKYRVEEAADGRQGLSVLQNSGSVALVLLDITEDGFAFLKTVQEDPAMSDVPVIVMSGTRDSGEEKCLSLGAKDFIEYPCNPEVLMRRIHNFIKYREAREALHEVETESLTGVLTRQGFFRRMEKTLSENPGTDYSLLMTDVEDFRGFIERYGVENGDLLLKKIAETLVTAAGKDGLVGRVGADQFACLLPAERMAGTDGVAALYGRMSEKEVFPGIRFVGKASLYEHVDHSLSPVLLCGRAAAALRMIRHQIDHSLAVFSEETQEIQKRMSRLEQDMRPALEEGQFKVYYQPKHDTATGRLVGAEALLRWVHPELGLLSPGEFIPLFERSGFITYADLFAWKRTCENQRRWLDRGLTVVPVSVNASRRDFELSDLLERIRALAEENRVDPSLLHIEVTETMFTQQTELIRKKLQEARKSGFAIELDDFGTGYSSMAMLSEMPLDIVKLDISFVEREIGAKRARILASMVSLARSLGLSTLAEGVETQEQRDLLSSLGCGVIQGFYFSKPLPEDEFEEYLRRSMDDGIKAPAQPGPVGSRCYVIDEDYHILRFNQAAKDMYPQLQTGKKCHQCLMNADKPCDVCPVKNGIRGQTVYLDPLRGVYESVDAVEIPLDDGKTGHILVLAEVRDQKQQ